MAFTLGSEPDTLTVILVQGADFVQALKRKDGTNWPNGAEVSLEFSNGTKWTATLTAERAVWNVPSEQVDTLITARPRGVKLWYVEGDLNLLWATGEPDLRRA